MRGAVCAAGGIGGGCMGRRGRAVVLALWCASGVLGCSQAQNRHYLGEADLAYYKDRALSVDYPNVDAEVNDAAQFTDQPPTVRDPADMPVWELTLAEAVQLAIAGSKVIRSRGAFKSPGNPLMANPDRVTSQYDPSIQEMSTNFFQRGPEAALAAFDSQLQLSMSLARNELIQNNALLGGGILGGGVLEADVARLQSGLSKTFATGGTLQLSHDWNYSHTNQPFQLFPGYYQAAVGMNYRHPLLAGGGLEYTAIAGPSSRNIPGILIVDQGVLIARINTDITLADFELNATNLVKDVEDQYWELSLAYRTYAAELEAQQAALLFWQTTKRRADVGALKGAVVDEGQARENYFGTRARVENAVSQLYIAEAQLRRLLGLPVQDGRFIRPVDEPLASEYLSDWTYSLTESLSRRVELRRQKWQIKSLELQLRAAESLVRPRLDFVGSYQLNGFGEKLFGANNPYGTREQQYQSAYNTLIQGNQESWDVGFEFSLPVGFRQALAQQRNLELRVSKARAVLAAQELEVSHELGHAWSMIATWYQLAETNRDRHLAALKQLEAVQREYEAGRLAIDLVLRTQANVAGAETQYYTALTRYNQAIADWRMRKGSLLEDSNIHLAEGEWTQEARVEALRRAWARSFGKGAEDHLEDRTKPVAVPDWPGTSTPFLTPAATLPMQPAEAVPPAPGEAVEPLPAENQPLPAETDLPPLDVQPLPVEDDAVTVDEGD